MEKRYIKGVTRLDLHLFDVLAWHKGESQELEKWLGFGFYNSIFAVEKNNLVVYYDEEECDKFYEILDEKLTEDLFNEICDSFFELIAQSKNAETKEEIFQIIVACWPALVIFEEISNYPEYANEGMLQRLMRVRKNTESFVYDLAKKVESSLDSHSYVFFQGNVIKAPFEEFIKIKNYKIVEQKNEYNEIKKISSFHF